jgi:uncharacterized HhH-GPD family protein
MAGRTQDLCRLLVERYDGRAENLWADVPDGDTVLRRLGELPGFGAQKSKIFVALLGKRYGVTPPGWREAAGDYGLEGSRRSVADVTGPESLAEVRRFKGREAVATGASTETGPGGTMESGPGGAGAVPGAAGQRGDGCPWPRASSSRGRAGRSRC